VKQEGERPFISIFRSPRERGFTLVEIMIVISLIIVIASLVVPFALRARAQSNQAATIGNLRTVSSAAESYRNAMNPPAYPVSLDEMVNSSPSYLDSAWSSNERQGYRYNYVVAGDRETYSLTANPRVANISGVDSFCVDHSNVIRIYAAPASASGTPRGCDASGDPI